MKYKLVYSFIENYSCRLMTILPYKYSTPDAKEMKKVLSKESPLLAMCEDVWRVITLYLPFCDHISISLCHRYLRFLVSMPFLNRFLPIRKSRFVRCCWANLYQASYFCKGRICLLSPQWRSKKLKIVYSLSDTNTTSSLLTTSFAELQHSCPTKPIIPLLVSVNTFENTEQMLIHVGYRFYSLNEFFSGDSIDVMDDCGIWYPGRILVVTDKKIRVNFKGWSSKWNRWYDKQDPGIAPAGTFVDSWRTKCKVGDPIEFRFPSQQSRWYEGVIVYHHGHEIVVKMKNEWDEVWTYPLQSEDLCAHGTHTKNYQEGYRSTHFCVNHPAWWKKKDPNLPPLGLRIVTFATGNSVYSMELLDPSTLY